MSMPAEEGEGGEWWGCIQSSRANRHAHLDRLEKTGKKPQAVSIAPKPESAPRMTVPMTVSRESVDASTLCAGMPAGSGTYERARRKRKFGMR